MKKTEQQKQILFLTPRLPFPIIGGDKLKAYYTIKYLAEKHKVTLVSFFQGDQSKRDSYVEEIRKLGVEVFVIPLYPVKAAISIIPRLLKAPLEILYYTQKKYRKIVNELLKERDFDIAFSFFMRSAEYIKSADLKKVLMSEDCRTLYQKRSWENSTNFVQRIVRKWEYNRLKVYEPEIVNYFDVVTLVTNDDINEMRKQNPVPCYKLLTNGVDISKFFPLENKDWTQKTILFAGKLDVWANVLMTKKIVGEIFPIIKAKVPDAKLQIVGANPPKSLFKLRDKDIQVIANVPEMLPYLQQANLFLHPHSGGSGIQNKLLEAMAAGCPVVTTKTGNQGIEAKNNEEVLLANDSAELAERAIEILSSEDFARKIASNARQLIERKHSWEIIFSQIDDIIQNL